jgi:hypothetical protein
LSRTQNASPRPTRRISNETHHHTRHHDSALGGFRGPTKLVNITEDVRKYATEQGISESKAVEKGLKEKSDEFVEKGAEVCAKA